MSTYNNEGNPSFAETFNNLDELMTAIKDNKMNLISARNLRDVSLTLWRKIDDTISGVQGVQGNTGQRGFQGFNGVQGDRGTAGFQGFQGFVGNIGNDGGNSVRYRYGNPTNSLEFNLNTDTNWGASGDSRHFVFHVSSFSQWWTSLKNYIDNNGSAYLQLTEVDTNTLPKNIIYKINTIDNISGQINIMTTNLSGEPSPNTIIAGKYYTVSWVLNGANGFQGNIGFQGYQGTGVQGMQGYQGINGLQGFQGIGYQGVQGLMGVQGLQGVIGTQGNIGFQGFQGAENDLLILSPLVTFSGNQKYASFDAKKLLFNWIGLNGKGTNNDGFLSSNGIYTIELYRDNGLVYTSNVFNPIAQPNYSFDCSIYNITPSMDNYLLVYPNGISTPLRIETTYRLVGVQGLQGTQGTIGLQGIQGYSGFGLQGLQGINGFQGFQGTGEQGVQGFQGVIGFQGYVGFGMQGVKGDIGYQGFQGFQGSGFQGVQGERGESGIQGSIGIGYQGFQGTGVQGYQGVIGLQGSNGTGIINITETGRIGLVSPATNTYYQTDNAIGHYIYVSGRWRYIGAKYIKLISATTYTVQPNLDIAYKLYFTNTCTVTIPTNIAAGTDIEMYSVDGSQITIIEGSGMTLSYLAGDTNVSLLSLSIVVCNVISDTEGIVIGGLER